MPFRQTGLLTGSQSVYNGMDQYQFVINTLSSAFSLMLSFWWVYLPILLFIGLMTAFQFYTKAKHIAGIKWILLEIRIPAEITKSPKAMENVFIGLHGILIPPKWRERFFKGKVVDWFSFEMVTINGEPHFYVRAAESYRKLVQAQIYAQYPDAEVKEVPDYVAEWPPMPTETHDLWGGELMLTKDTVYPIRTYPEFEETAVGKEDVKRVDSMALFAEVLSSLEPGEYLGIQLLVRPTGDSWVKKGAAVVEKLQGKTAKAEAMFGNMFYEIDKLIPGHTPPPEKKETKPEQASGKQEQIKAIEKKFYKLGFETGIRFIYAAQKDIYHAPHVSGVTGAFKQFNSQTLNGFKLNLATATIGKWPFKNQKIYNRKVFLLNKFKRRAFPNPSFVLNTEELATVYHLPDRGVKAPLLPRVETRKGEPPAGLPM